MQHYEKVHLPQVWALVDVQWQEVKTELSSYVQQHAEKKRRGICVAYALPCPSSHTFTHSLSSCLDGTYFHVHCTWCAGAANWAGNNVSCPNHWHRCSSGSPGISVTSAKTYRTCKVLSFPLRGIFILLFLLLPFLSLFSLLVRPCSCWCSLQAGGLQHACLAGVWFSLLPV